MAKIYGLFGTMSGKVADVVMSVRNGQQIVRRYQPIVADRKSEGQTAARAKLKLMSQLAAVFAPVIAMPREGAVSSRNRFVKKNYAAAIYSDGSADVIMADLVITSSVIGLPNIGANRGSENINVGMSSPVMNLDVNRVVYVAFVRGTDNSLRLYGTATAIAPGVNNAWQAIMPLTSGELFVYAYGVRDNTELARTVFGNMSLVTAQDIARLLVNRVLTEADVSVTETRYVNLPVEA